jgi:hypothetical protein
MYNITHKSRPTAVAALGSRPLVTMENILGNHWIVLSGLRTLRIASKDGGPSNEYRIQERSVEFRAVGEQGNSYPQPSKWRALNGDEIKLHFALHTPVAEWLDKNLYSLAFG